MSTSSPPAPPSTRFWEWKRHLPLPDGWASANHPDGTLYYWRILNGIPASRRA